MEMIVAENLAATLTHATATDVESHVTPIALGEEDGFLQEGHAEKLSLARAESTRQAADRTGRTRRARYAV